ncbi:hypothetical protein N9J83_01465 [Opitutales bacterium]|nr:hypothetical protein [Opitutales bacterium]
MKGKWTKQEVEILLLARKEKKSTKEVKLLLPNRSIQSISRKIAKLGLTKPANWSNEEEVKLQNLIKSGLSPKQIFNGNELPNRTYLSILNRWKYYRQYKPKEQEVPKGYKKCSKCGKQKAATSEFFHIRKESADGFNAMCRLCRNQNGIPQKIPKGYQHCCYCQKVLPANSEFFNANKNKPNGVQSKCRECQIKEYHDNSEYYSKRAKKYREANKEVLKKKSIKYREENSEILKARKKLYYENNKKVILQKMHQYSLENKERLELYRQKYREENRGKLKRKTQIWYRKNKENRRLYNKDYRERNKTKINEQRFNARLAKRKDRTRELNSFYRNNDVPKYIWHKDEFATEEDFQSAIEHIIVNKHGIQIERWTFLEELGVPDIYLPEIDLIIEVKLHSSMWTKDSVEEQSMRYSEISDTIIVSLDGMPEYWIETEAHNSAIFWFNPEQLFQFVDGLIDD